MVTVRASHFCSIRPYRQVAKKVQENARSPDLREVPRAGAARYEAQMWVICVRVQMRPLPGRAGRR